MIGNYLSSQSLEIPKNIKTIILKSSKLSSPFISFGDQLELSFDDLDADEKNYYYQIQHFDYMWNLSKLYKSEYIDGFDDIRIKNIRNSFNTLQPYTNYTLNIPNQDVKLKLSGNYSISIHLSNGEKIFEKRFSYINNRTSIEIIISKSNDIENFKTDQKIKINLNCEDCTKIYNSSSKLKVIVIKNYNWSNSIIVEKPKFIFSNNLIYDDIYFAGGNEFLNFDNSNINSTNYRIYKSKLTDIYNNFLVNDKERTNQIYEFNPDINGDFLINSNNNYDLDIENDYGRVHFNLKTNICNNSNNIYLLGRFNNFIINDDYKLIFDEKKKLYTGSFLFKQGFYNYKYGYTNSLNPNTINYLEGNFWQTENLYTVLIFHKKNNEKYFKLIGEKSIKSMNIKN
tara:strand:+ start:780 stop:1973 length:1194 start_codon:yes stop_codon:yes gene_type:complete